MARERLNPSTQTIDLSQISLRNLPRNREDELLIDQMVRHIESGGEHNPLILAPTEAKKARPNLFIRALKRLGRGLYEVFPLDTIISKKWTPLESRTLRPHRNRKPRIADGFELIEGLIEFQALVRLGKTSAECLILNLDNEQIALHKGLQSNDKIQGTLGFQMMLFDVLQPRADVYAKMKRQSQRRRAAAMQQPAAGQTSVVTPAPQIIQLPPVEANPAKTKLQLASDDDFPTPKLNLSS